MRGSSSVAEWSGAELGRVDVTLSDEEVLERMEGFLLAVSLGWEHVISFIELNEPDPEVQRMLKGLMDV